MVWQAPKGMELNEVILRIKRSSFKPVIPGNQCHFLNKKKKTLLHSQK